MSCGSTARDWAQVHGKDGQIPEDYQPMCRSCHFEYDGVSQILRTADHSHAIGKAYGQGGGKLTVADAEEVLSLLQSGLGLREVGRRLGIGHKSVARIRDGKSHPLALIRHALKISLQLDRTPEQANRIREVRDRLSKVSERPSPQELRDVIAEAKDQYVEIAIEHWTNYRVV